MYVISGGLTEEMLTVELPNKRAVCLQYRLVLTVNRAERLRFRSGMVVALMS